MSVVLEDSKKNIKYLNESRVNMFIDFWIRDKCPDTQEKLM